MGTTPTYSWPYPEPTDPVANGAQDIEDLALAVETTVSGLTYKILQVVSTTKTDTFTTTSTSFTDLTGLNLSITPSAATSKVLLILTFGTFDSDGSNRLFAQVERDGTPIGVGDAASNRTPAGIFVTPATGNRPTSNSWSYLDSPASTSALTYQTQVMVASGTLYVNRSQLDTDAANYARTVSTLTALEVSA